MITVATTAWLLALPAHAQGFSCTPKKTCKAMKNCAEAVYFLRDCGHKARDGNGNGIPCEKLCGKTREIMEERLKAQSSALGALLFKAPLVAFSCNRKKRCGQVLSCEEARFQLDQCGNTDLDGNGDGIPCNALCR